MESKLFRYRQSLGYRINEDHGANLLEIYLNQSQGEMRRRMG